MPYAQDIVATQESWTLLSQRQARETLRTVYRVNSLYTVKKFELPSRVKRYRRPWIIEDRALRRLDGTGAPRSLGFFESIDSGTRTVWLVREYLEGEVRDSLPDGDVPATARLLAGLHRQFIITDDTNIHNFLKKPDGTMAFIDLGRARLFPHAGLLLYLNIGWELAKLRRECLHWNAKQWITFREHYFRATPCAWPTRVLIMVSLQVSIRMRMIRKLVHGKSPFS